MKRSHYGLTLFLCAAACTQVEPVLPPVEEDIPVQERTASDPVPVEQPATREACVYLSEDMALALELRAKGAATRMDALDDALEAIGAVSLERLFPDAGPYEPRTRREGLHRWYKAVLREPVTRAEAVLGEVPGIEYVEAVPPASPTAIAYNDPYWNDLWGINNQRYPGMDVNCKRVWEEYTCGNPAVVVAIIDGGIQLDHPDLAAHCLKSGHYNYVDNSTTLVPHSHGTHVAGTIAAVGNNGIGIAGIAGGNAATGTPGVSLLSCQVFKTTVNTNSGKETTTSGGFERAIKEAADKGAVICQNSWGYTIDANGDGNISDQELSTAEYYFHNIPRAFREAVDYFIRYAGCDNDGNQLPDSPMQGGLVVFAAGNDNIPYGPPANYEPIVSVGAIAQDGSRAYFSDYGDWVDICAPGVSIVSTIPGSKYANYQGTSMACPHVSGVAALVASMYAGPGFTNEELKTRLLSAGQIVPASNTVGPLVDAYGAVTYGGTEPPGEVTEYAASTLSNAVVFRFPAARAYGYYLLAAQDESALLRFDPYHPDGSVAFTQFVPPEGTPEGEALTARLDGLAFETDYVVSLCSFNYNRRRSAPAPARNVRTGINHPPVIEWEGNAFSFRQRDRVELPLRLYDPDGHGVTVDFETDGIARIEPGAQEGDYTFHLNCTMVEKTPATFQGLLRLTDAYGLSTEKSIRYTVDENHAPTLLQGMEDRQLFEVGGTLEVELPGYFTDPDEDELQYSALSLNSAVLHAACRDGVLTVTALGQGTGQVSVTATDWMGKQVKTRFNILVRSRDEALSLDPGPEINGKLTILTGIREEETAVRIQTPTGGLVYDQTVTASAFRPIVIDLAPLAPGRYFLYVTYGGQTTRKTLVKK